MPDLASLPTLYDYQLLDTSYNPISESALVSSLSSADVVFIGEYHGNHASHLLQTRLLAALHRNNQRDGRATILSMEMFDRAQQAILDDYLAGNIGERYLINKAPAWKNYQGSYRPLVEYARQHSIPVLAANASADIVRCIGRQGEAYIAVLDIQEKRLIAAQPFAEIIGYEEKFFAAMSGANGKPAERMHNTYLAQITRDNTMAESIARALGSTPGGQVVHINGSFHSDGHLGTVAALKRLRPELAIKVFTPVRIDVFNGEKSKSASEQADDFVYLVNPQPEEFVDREYRKQVLAERFAEAGAKAKRCRAVEP
ncbi:ChaN family lipoprotein [Microbulbifer sp. Q7]|uniref:ChaN family lipoprotein n=1 Tax=Microbulbifer sp. Q7 TaxID=1785091 RepID=UPI000ACFEF5B|nr:ChaN family lipoprotein [Microbulbifer sp. Q7]